MHAFRRFRRSLVLTIVAAVAVACTGAGTDDSGVPELTLAAAITDGTALATLWSQLDLADDGGADAATAAELRESLRAGSTMLDAEIDFANRRSVLGYDGPDGIEPVAVFDDLRMHMRRANPGDQPWAVVDFADPDVVAPSDDELPVGVSAVAPHLMVELLAGLRDMREAGTDEIEGAIATGYDGQLDWAAALDDRRRESLGAPALTDERREGLNRIREAMGLDDPTFPAQVWVDDNGAPLRIEWLVGQPWPVDEQTDGIVETTFTLELFSFGAQVNVAVPEPGQAAQVRGFVELVEQAWGTQAMEASGSGTRGDAVGGADGTDGDTPAGGGPGGTAGGGDQAGPGQNGGTTSPGPRRPPPGFPPPPPPEPTPGPSQPGSPPGGSPGSPGGGQQPGGDDEVPWWVPPEVRQQIEEHSR